jgi:nucleotide-binding universal stress UspA family protein
MSACKSILVHMDTSAHCAARLQIVGQLAERLDSDLTALYAVTPQVWLYPGAFAVGAEAAPGINQFEADRVAQAKEIFDTAISAGLQRVTWAQSTDLPVRDFARHAYYADLLVLGQRDPKDVSQADVPPDFVESVVIESGKPVLVVPHIGVSGPVGQVALVAWKETRESARAVAAALPLLQQAERVEVATWGDPSSTRPSGPTGIETFLRRHGVRANFSHQGKESPQLGEYMLSLVDDVSADLLVMGCYGHSRARELILGGATRTILNSLTVPVLMAH